MTSANTLKTANSLKLRYREKAWRGSPSSGGQKRPRRLRVCHWRLYRVSRAERYGGWNRRPWWEKAGKEGLGEH